MIVFFFSRLILNKVNNLIEPKLSNIKDLVKVKKPYGTFFLPNLLNGKVILSHIKVDIKIEMKIEKKIILKRDKV